MPGNLTDLLFPPEVLSYLMVVSQVALVLLLFAFFAVGHDLDRGVPHTRLRAVPAVGGATFVTPMLPGAGTVFIFGGWYSEFYRVFFVGGQSRRQQNVDS